MSKKLLSGKRIAAAVLALVMMFTMFPVMQANAVAMELGCGGLEYAWEDLIIYDAPSGGNVIGKIFENESFTILIQDAPAGYLWVDYSTSSGAKQGYVHIPNDEWGGRPGAPARVKNTSNVYYGPTNTGANYQKAGAVYTGEYVSIIAVCGQSAYIEYNTTAGRKRGYTPIYNLEVSQCTPDAWRSVYNSSGETDRERHRLDCDATMTVYAGPTKLYATVGTVSDETVYRYGSDIHIGPYTAFYIEYYITGTENTTKQVKSGFIVY